MKTYQLTASQIFEIYRAGKEQGNEEAVAYDWGSMAPEDHRLEEVLIWGDGILTGKDMDYSDKLGVWAEFKKEAGL